ncbi:MAG TPA: hypothetical protein VN736_21275 [Candidatus Limnocylindrales bacterium]|nr:hypothetical protein [Candidatus Limnocylindrales bacterium]
MTPTGQDPRPDGKLKTGCWGCFTTVIIVPLFAYVLAAPVSFHLGGRWTPIAQWKGVGRLRDSAGVVYGLFLQLNFSPTLDVRNQATTCCEIAGKAQVCTEDGARYQFKVSGQMSGAWLRTNGAKVELTLSEAERPKLPRTFRLAGVWRGADLNLDDQKSMYTNFLPGGKLTPNPMTRAGVPEKHATVVVSWGDLSDFDRACAGLRGSR